MILNEGLRFGDLDATVTRRGAVSGQFRNTMKNLLVIQLNTQIWGFAGQASGQREFADDQTDLHHVYLIVVPTRCGCRT